MVKCIFLDSTMTLLYPPITIFSFKSSNVTVTTKSNVQHLMLPGVIYWKGWVWIWGCLCLDFQSFITFHIFFLSLNLPSHLPSIFNLFFFISPLLLYQSVSRQHLLVSEYWHCHTVRMSPLSVVMTLSHSENVTNDTLVMWHTDNVTHWQCNTLTM